jgi:hypothetical protein
MKVCSDSIHARTLQKAFVRAVHAHLSRVCTYVYAPIRSRPVMAEEAKEVVEWLLNETCCMTVNFYFVR